MRQRLQPLKAACLPFVTRALRGPNRRRALLGSGLLMLLVVLMGGFIGRSPSYAAHDMRQSLGLEQGRWEREELEFTIFVQDEQERRELLREEHDWNTIHHRATEGWMLLDTVAGPHVIPPRPYQELQRRARALRNARMDLAPPDLTERRRYQHFDWNRPRDRQRLQAVLDAELQPQVVVYESPLGVADTIRLIGLTAGGVLLLLWLVLAPLWVGVQLAQELHENTLQPLTGTALTARQLVLGFAAGSLAPVAIVAAPQLLLVLVAALGSGRTVPALGAVSLGLAMGLLSIGLCMLAALAVGKQRSPGLVGIGLSALLGVSALTGVAIGLHVHADTLGMVTLLPGAGPCHLLAEAFAPRAHLSGVDALALDLRLGLAMVGALVLAAASLRAIERHVGGTHREGALHRGEAMVVALVLGVLAVAALPSSARFGPAFLAGAALALIPMQLLLVARIPGGDVPPALRRIPVVPLLREQAAWLGGVLVIALLAAGLPQQFHPEAIVGLVHWGWAVVMLAMITLRGAGLPTSIPTKVWLMVCLGFVAIEYVCGVIWCLDRPSGESLFPLGAAHPLLGLVHVGMFVWIPISLIRGLTPADRPALDLHAREG
ncbi:hypothetical protein [Paraliomyxa miuraensis]|uniref:hypothetical protein n=1 Tax=Paraliomyxa miuraensis TaxID=376150 RepID=UPI00224EAD7C|nr:hypothetical protein [Paraliomyxa miuraensis]MCX4240001.1 hypothetical protein [Paraliomyxa miuraensis]